MQHSVFEIDIDIFTIVLMFWLEGSRSDFKVHTALFVVRVHCSMEVNLDRRKGKLVCSLSRANVTLSRCMLARHVTVLSSASNAP